MIVLRGFKNRLMLKHPYDNMINVALIAHLCELFVAYTHIA